MVNGARPALFFAAGVVTLGAFLSLLIPADAPPPNDAEPAADIEPGSIAVAVEML